MACLDCETFFKRNTGEHFFPHKHKGFSDKFFIDFLFKTLLSLCSISSNLLLS